MPFPPLAALQVKRFQKHKVKKIQLDQVTCLVGPSARGKSSMLRAVRTLCLGKPDGPAYVRRKGKAGYLLTLALDDDTTVQRRRGPGGCRMRLGGRVYATTGGRTPDDIQAVLGTAPVNFQMQHDPPFWVADPPAVVGAALNALTGLDQIDAAVRLAAGRERETAVKAKLLKQQYQDAKAEAKKLAWVSKAVAAKKKLDRLEQKVITLSDAERELAVFLEQKPPPAVPDITALKKVRERADAAALAEAEVRHGIEDIAKLEDELCGLKKEVRELQKRLDRHAGRPCPVCKRPLPGRARRSSG